MPFPEQPAGAPHWLDHRAPLLLALHRPSSHRRQMFHPLDTSCTSSVPGWQCANLDQSYDAVNGVESLNNGTWTISGWGLGADNSFFVYQDLNQSSGSISATLQSLQNGWVEGSGGLMLRGSTDPSAPDYYIASNGGGFQIWYRMTYGYTTQSIAPDLSGISFTNSMPMQVKIVWNSFVVYTQVWNTAINNWSTVPNSYAAVNWGDVQAGMWVMAGADNSSQATLTASGVTVSGSGPAYSGCPSTVTCGSVNNDGGAESTVGTSWDVVGAGGNIAGCQGGPGAESQAKFEYEPIGGGGTVSAQVTMANTDSADTNGNESGVMIKQNTGDSMVYGAWIGAVYYNSTTQTYMGTLSAFWDGGPPSQYCASRGGSPGISVTLPVSIQITQSGDTFSTVYKQAGSNSYTALPSSTVQLNNIGDNLLAGLMTAGGDGGYSVSTAFNNVSVKPSGPTANSSMASGNLETAVASSSVGCPIDCATGNFWHSFDELAIPGRGIPLDFALTYNSALASQNSPLGYGWTDSSNLFLTLDGNNVITLHEENGSEVPFSPTSAGPYVSPSWVFSTLTNNGNGTFTHKRKDQTQYTFTAPTISAAGLLQKEVDANGYTTTLV